MLFTSRGIFVSEMVVKSGQHPLAMTTRSDPYSIFHFYLLHTTKRGIFTFQSHMGINECKKDKSDSPKLKYFYAEGVFIFAILHM